MPKVRQDRPPIGEDGAGITDEQRVSKEDVDIGVSLEIFGDFRECAFQILFIAIEPADNIAGGPAKPRLIASYIPESHSTNNFAFVFW